MKKNINLKKILSILKQKIYHFEYKEYKSRRNKTFADIYIDIEEYYPYGQIIVWTPVSNKEKNIPNEKVGIYQLIEHMPHTEPGIKYEKPIKVQCRLCSSLLGKHIDEMTFDEYLIEKKIWIKNKLTKKTNIFSFY